MGISFLTILVFYLPSDSGEKVSNSITNSGLDKNRPKLLEKTLNFTIEEPKHTIIPHKYKALPQITPTFLIMPAPGTILCRWNLVISAVISNYTQSWRLYKKNNTHGSFMRKYVICYSYIIQFEIITCYRYSEDRQGR